MDQAWQAECASLGIDPHRLLPEGVRALEVEPDHELWPEHAAAWQVFMRCQTQWRRSRCAMSGRVDCWGLHYGGVQLVMDRTGVPADQADQVFAEVQLLEDEFLTIKAGA